MVFYAPWCSHCIHFSEPYMKLAEENKNKRVTFAAISCTAYRSLCSINHVRGYPSILAFNIPTTAPGLYIIHSITYVISIHHL